MKNRRLRLDLIRMTLPLRGTMGLTMDKMSLLGILIVVLWNPIEFLITMLEKQRAEEEVSFHSTRTRFLFWNRLKVRSNGRFWRITQQRCPCHFRIIISIILRLEMIPRRARNQCRMSLGHPLARLNLCLL